VADVIEKLKEVDPQLEVRDGINLPLLGVKVNEVSGFRFVDFDFGWGFDKQKKDKRGRCGLCQ